MCYSTLSTLVCRYELFTILDQFRNSKKYMRNFFRSILGEGFFRSSTFDVIIALLNVDKNKSIVVDALKSLYILIKFYSTTPIVSRNVAFIHSYRGCSPGENVENLAQPGKIGVPKMF